MADHDNTLVETTLNGRWPLTLPRARAERAEWHTDTGWERARLDRMHQHLTPDDVVYYLGAECGDMPALVASWGPQMVLVEPNWKAWPMIRAIWQANQLDEPLACFDGFAADHNRHPRLAGHWAEHGWPAAADNDDVSPYDFRVLHQYPDVPALTIDEICRRLNVPPTVVSLDIEGAEMRTLVGAEHTLTDHRPVVFCSTHPNFLPQYGDNVDTLHAYADDMGYDIEVLDVAHEVHELWTPR